MLLYFNFIFEPLKPRFIPGDKLVWKIFFSILRPTERYRFFFLLQLICLSAFFLPQNWHKNGYGCVCVAYILGRSHCKSFRSPLGELQFSFEDGVVWPDWWFQWKNKTGLWEKCFFFWKKSCTGNQFRVQLGGPLAGCPINLLGMLVPLHFLMHCLACNIKILHFRCRLIAKFT